MPDKGVKHVHRYSSFPNSLTHAFNIHSEIMHTQGVWNDLGLDTAEASLAH